jgi:murein endopeptidase
MDACRYQRLHQRNVTIKLLCGTQATALGDQAAVPAQDGAPGYLWFEQNFIAFPQLKTVTDASATSL